jgi:hypothetical protein
MPNSSCAVDGLDGGVVESVGGHIKESFWIPTIPLAPFVFESVAGSVLVHEWEPGCAPAS